jgi:glycosyltransferase involved in cell wall biosynthesis
MIFEGKAFERRIFWDGYGLDRIHSGIHRYGTQLADGLAQYGIKPIVIARQDSNLYLPGTDVLPIEPSKYPAIFSDSKIAWPLRVQRTLQDTLHRENRATVPVLIHGMSNINLSWKNTPGEKIRKVLTIHDLIPLLAPKAVSRAYLFQFKHLLPRVIEVADAIIAVSSWTAQGLAQLFPRHTGKIQLIRNGFQPFDKQQQFDLPPLGTGSKLKLVSVSRYEEYKEFNLLRDILFKRGNDFILVLVTNERGVKWAREEAQGLINKGSLKVLTNVDDSTLRTLYRSAHAMVHPSRFEGFCLPAAECLASGTPVVYRAGTGIDETVGATVGVPMSPNASVFDWIAGIEYAANLKYKQKFMRDIVDHLDQARKWPDVVAEVWKLYQSLLA